MKKLILASLLLSLALGAAVLRRHRTAMAENGAWAGVTEWVGTRHGTWNDGWSRRSSLAESILMKASMTRAAKTAP